MSEPSSLLIESFFIFLNFFCIYFGFVLLSHFIVYVHRYTLCGLKGIKSWRLDIHSFPLKSIWSSGIDLEWMDTIDYNVYKL